MGSRAHFLLKTFLMWAIFKVFIKFVTIFHLLCFCVFVFSFFLAVRHMGS